MAYVMGDLCILGPYNDYSLATPLYNSATIQAIPASYSVTDTRNYTLYHILF